MHIGPYKVIKDQMKQNAQPCCQKIWNALQTYEQKMQDKIVILTIGPLLSQCSTVSDLRQFIIDVHSCGLTVPAPEACTEGMSCQTNPR